LLQFRNISQEDIRQNLHVWPNADQQNSQERAVQNTIRMVGDDNNGPGCRDSRLIVWSHAQFNPHLGQQILQPEALSRTMRAPV
jgi:hypothetical protein